MTLSLFPARRRVLAVSSAASVTPARRVEVLRAVVVRRGAAALVALGVPAHVALLATHGHDVGVGVVLAVMTAACAECAVKVWRRPDRRALGAVIGMSLAMAVLHVALALGPLAGHHAGAGAGVAELHGHGVGTHRPAAMLAVAALDIGAAWVAALAQRVSR
ncbi:hypothetical protein GCM10011512_00740 [Tersicoccus solisilvae]|uniref:Uncharacterized protein n=1 Tax=Tersicoccus solisilvae TaxID=1882339 RepID=A0ABQ1NJF9_9MICC|nr:hypothetical protein [Tersicoccus solisilvae]GGC78059.1 hypothetical protein GCM10011512_00740 [Tersicoccus solisilvae]